MYIIAIYISGTETELIITTVCRAVNQPLKINLFKALKKH